MRNYQRRKGNPYLLPHNVYMQTLYIIKDYNRLRQLEQDIIHCTHKDDVPGGSGTGDPTAHKAAKLEKVGELIRAIESGLSSVPNEYRQGVLRSITKGEPYPDYAHENTWKKYRSRMVYYVAERLNLT